MITVSVNAFNAALERTRAHHHWTLESVTFIAGIHSSPVSLRSWRVICVFSSSLKTEVARVSLPCQTQLPFSNVNISEETPPLLVKKCVRKVPTSAS
jgi:hypothetical protein